MPSTTPLHIQRDADQEPPTFTHDHYTVGWICAIPIELAAAKAGLDQTHGRLSNSPDDQNSYTLGEISGHYVAITCMPLGVYGTTSATAVATQMKSTFKSLRFILMVGVAGGAPSDRVDIRLGDVVVSMPTAEYNGVVQYDYGKAIGEGMFKPTGRLNKPAEVLLKALPDLRSNDRLLPSRLAKRIAEMMEKHPESASELRYPGVQQDVLFEARYNHVSPGEPCNQCDARMQVLRDVRATSDPMVHYGLIASANGLMKYGPTRDKWAKELGVLCFEMEAAGLMDSFSPLVIRGICDYADSHKNKHWQGYAAAVAAAYAKELLLVISPAQLPLEGNSKVKMTALDDEQREKLMKSLWFEEINARHMNIENPHQDTCEWLLKKPEYRDWLDPNKVTEHHGFMWIRGKAGAGKSTLMKFALAHARKTVTDTIVIFFFFNARGTTLEKSTLGMYRSLLFQLLEQIPALRSIFDSLGLLSLSSRIPEWTTGSLKALFEVAVRNLGTSSLLCFIDALDECNEDDIRRMVLSFESLGNNAVNSHSNFQVLFASRHYPNITISKYVGLDLDLQAEHQQDIIKYIDSTLKLNDSGIAKQIRSELKTKSSGVFLWVVLVVEILNKEHDRGRPQRTLLRKLNEIPADLHKLIRDIFAQGTQDKTSRDELLLCTQWLLFGARSLTATELYYGIVFGTNPEILADFDPGEITEDSIKKYILDVSKGLAEIKYDPGREYAYLHSWGDDNTKVQFIHESVRDFLLKEKGLREIWPEIGDNFEGESHERLKHHCWNYTQMDHVATIKSQPRFGSPDFDNLRESAILAFPFLQYAVFNVLHHANAAQVYGIGQESFLGRFHCAKWITLYNFIGGPSRYSFDHYTSNTSLPYILAEMNLSDLIKIHPSSLSCFEVEDGEYGTPFFAALNTFNYDAVQSFLEVQAASQPANSRSRYLCQEYLQRGISQFMDYLPFEFQKGVGVLSHLAEYGDEVLLALFTTLFDVDIDTIDAHGRTPLSHATGSGKQPAVELLIKLGANLQSQDHDGRTLLSWAASGGSEAAVRLFLQRDLDIASKDVNGRTPLSWAAAKGRSDKVIRLLLAMGANIEGKDNSGRTPLSLAVVNYYPSYDVVNLLLMEGANIEAKDNGGRTPLSLAVGEEIYKSQQVISLLLKEGADVEAKDNNARTPLSWAVAQAQNEDNIRLLLEMDANIEAKDNNGQTPLSWAVARYFTTEDNVLLLLDWGADVDAKDNNGRTPLSWAASGSNNEDNIRVLLAEGAEVDAKDNTGRTPLSWAVTELENEENIRLFLEEGADIDARDDNGRTPLSWAVTIDHCNEDTIQLLLDSGADVNAKDNEDRTPLSWAVTVDHYLADVIQTLLDGGADVNAKDNNDRTPLAWAEETGHEWAAYTLRPLSRVSLD